MTADHPGSRLAATRSRSLASASPQARARSLAFALSVACALAASIAIAFGSAARAEEPAPLTDAAVFEWLKRLAGTWEGKAGFGEPTEATEVTYRVTANGNAVMETLFGGTSHEMVTMYYLDEGRLMLTHYCSSGNQPRMRRVEGADPRTVVFDFLDATGLASEKESHMHAGAITFHSEDHISSAWTMYQEGKPGGAAKFDLVRKR